MGRGGGRNFVDGDALDRCDRVVALVSSAYFDRSRYTTEEWSAAVVHGPGPREGRVVPVRVEDVPVEQMPAVLRPLVFRDVFGVDAGQARRVLLEAVAGPRRPDGEPVFPGRAVPGAPSRRGRPEPQFPGGRPRLVNAPPRNPVFTGRAQCWRRSGGDWLAGRWRWSRCAGWGAWASRRWRWSMRTGCAGPAGIGWRGGYGRIRR